MLFKYDVTVSIPVGKAAEILKVNLDDIEILAKAANDKSTLFTAITEKQPNPKNLKMFEDLASGILPPTAKAYKGLDVTVSPGESMQNRIVPLGLLPDHFKSYVNPLGQRLGDAIKDTYRIIRWRYDTGGKHTPFLARSFSF